MPDRDDRPTDIRDARRASHLVRKASEVTVGGAGIEPATRARAGPNVRAGPRQKQGASAMAWMTADGETKRLLWRDRTSVRSGLDTTTRLINGVWVTVPAARAPMVSWRAGSSMVVSE